MSDELTETTTVRVEVLLEPDGGLTVAALHGRLADLPGDATLTVHAGGPRKGRYLVVRAAT